MFERKYCFLKVILINLICFGRTRFNRFFLYYLSEIIYCLFLLIASIIPEGIVCASDIKLNTVGPTQKKHHQTSEHHFKLVKKPDVIFPMFLYLVCRDRNLNN